MEILLQPKKITKFLLIIVVILIVLHIIAHVFAYASHNNFFIKLYRFFDLDGENNFPSFYSAVTLLLCSILLFIISYLHKVKAEHWILWRCLSLIFLFLCFDEFVEIHEKIMVHVRELLHTSGIFYFAWVIPYGIFLIILGIIYFKFLFSLPQKTKKLFIIAGFIYVFGALGMELFAGLIFEIEKSTESIQFIISSTIEEILEMTGILIFIFALTDYIKNNFPQLSFTIK